MRTKTISVPIIIRMNSNLNLNLLPIATEILDLWLCYLYDVLSFGFRFNL